MDDNTDRVELSSECEIAESDHDPVADNFHTDLSAAETSRIIAPAARDDTAGSDKPTALNTSRRRQLRMRPWPIAKRTRPQIF